MRHGMTVASSRAPSLSPEHGNRLRLSFASPPDQLEDAVDHLVAAQRTWRGSDESAPRHQPSKVAQVWSHDSRSHSSVLSVLPAL